MAKPKGIREIIGRTRIIEGKRYKLHDSYLNRSKAVLDGSGLRAQGWNIRLVKVLGLWAVYKRRS